MVYEILLDGAEHAIPSRQIAQSLDIPHRELTRQIERERQSGKPICAAVAGDAVGVFRPKNAEELALYCKSLDRRLKSIQKTRKAMEDALCEMIDQEHIEWGDLDG